MANLNASPPVVVVHKGPRKNSKIELSIFTDIRVDDIIDGNKRKPPIPNEHEILEIGVGKVFEKKYREKYKL
jgi:hypothetical protein